MPFPAEDKAGPLEMPDVMQLLRAVEHAVSKTVAPDASREKFDAIRAALSAAMAGFSTAAEPAVAAAEPLSYQEALARANTASRKCDKFEKANLVLIAKKDAAEKKLQAACVEVTDNITLLREAREEQEKAQQYLRSLDTAEAAKKPERKAKKPSARELADSVVKIFYDPDASGDEAALQSEDGVQDMDESELAEIQGYESMAYEDLAKVASKHRKKEATLNQYLKKKKPAKAAPSKLPATLEDAQRIKDETEAKAKKSAAEAASGRAAANLANAALGAAGEEDPCL